MQQQSGRYKIVTVRGGYIEDAELLDALSNLGDEWEIIAIEWPTFSRASLKIVVRKRLTEIG